MRAVIITAQGAPGYTQFSQRDDDLIIAADGGYDAALAAGIVPRVLAGDMDSIDTAPEGVETICLPPVKDDTDTHYCVKLAVERGCDEVLILGGTGGRIDHTLANLHTLAFLAEKNIKAVLVDGGVEIYMLNNGYIELENREGRSLALIAYGGRAFGVCSSGVAYPLQNAVLTPVFPLGVSNTVTASTFRVSVEDGFLALLLL